MNKSNAMETISRRTFLKTSVVAAAGALMANPNFAQPGSAEIYTVRGEIPSRQTGFVLSRADWSPLSVMMQSLSPCEYSLTTPYGNRERRGWIFAED